MWWHFYWFCLDRVLDHDTYSAHDAIGKVYIDLNPLLAKEHASVISGWFPIYDTMHGKYATWCGLTCVLFFTLFSNLRWTSCWGHTPSPINSVAKSPMAISFLNWQGNLYRFLLATTVHCVVYIQEKSILFYLSYIFIYSHCTLSDWRILWIMVLKHKLCRCTNVNHYLVITGIRGDLHVIVKVDLFSDFNKFRQSSCGVQFLCSKWDLVLNPKIT